MANQKEKSPRYRRGETLYNWLGQLMGEMDRGKTPRGWAEEWANRFIDFVEEEVSRAYGRGIRDGRAQATGARARGSLRHREYPSAVQNGKLHPVRPDKREGA